MVSNVLSSLVFLIVIFPLSTSTSSLKVRKILAFLPTPVALSAGADEERLGFVLSTIVKLYEVLSLIPPKEFPEASSNAVASMTK